MRAKRPDAEIIADLQRRLARKQWKCARESLALLAEGLAHIREARDGLDDGRINHQGYDDLIEKAKALMAFVEKQIPEEAR